LWLATSNNLGEPNVSPKQLFLFKGRNKLIIANIASPKSLMNILENPNVCVTGIDIWKQKGIQCRGKAKVLSPQNKRFKKVEEEFRPFNKGKFRIQHFIEIQITQLKEIIAPSYFYYPTTEEEDQIKASKRTYLEGLPQELS
jgi:predicted pyridoxine 5'-phosphate oxidase superfamily flavin-nucleotide-binding protein